MEDLLLSVHVVKHGIYQRRADKINFIAEKIDPNGLILMESLLDETDRVAVSLDYLLSRFEYVEPGPSPREVFAAMVQFGGSFVQHLGYLGMHADQENRKLIRQTWPEYWAKYAEMAENADPLIPEDLPEDAEEGAE